MTSPTDHIATLAQADLLFFLAHVFTVDRGVADARTADVSTLELVQLIKRTGFADAGAIARDAAAWMAAQAECSATANADEHHRLFEGATVCPLNETAYVRRDKGAIIGDLCGFYRAFGWTPRNHIGEKPDHLVFELQFLAVLLTMLAQTQLRGSQEQRELTLDAIRKFGGDHFGDWLPVMVDHLANATQLDVYRALAALLRGVWDEVVAYHSIPVTPTEMIDDVPAIPTLARGDDPESDSPYEPCGFESAPGLVQLQHPPT